MAKPIWKDYIVSLGNTDGIDFRILVDDNIIYNGRSFLRPGASSNDIRINDICADFLVNALPAMSQAEFSALAFPIEFVVAYYDTTSEDWEIADSVEFLNDWSYDYDYDVDTMGMSFPINGHIDARQWLVYTAYDADDITATIYFADGTSSVVTIPIAIQADFDDDFNDDFARSVKSAGSGTAVFDLAQWDDVVKVTIGNSTFNVVTDCAQWALYYVNAYGGWDSLLIEGNTAEADALTRFTRDVEYDNRDISNRGRQNFVNEIAKTYTLNTSWLHDDESARMHHLLNSTEVYLGNIATGEMIPVILNNTETQYKTFKGNGGRLVNYQISVTLANDRIRR